MSEINTEVMTREELEATAKDLGLSFPHNAGDDTLRTKISTALGDTGNGESKPAAKPAKKDEAGEKHYEIIIARHDQDKQPVPVGVNGKTWLIQRGEKVIVPKRVVDNLSNAVQFNYDPATMKRTDIQSYPFQILREV